MGDVLRTCKRPTHGGIALIDGLVLRAQAGEQNAFKTLVQKYRQRVMKLSMR